MSENIVYCPGCMNAPADELGCSECGYVATTSINPLHLPPYTVLSGRYMIGTVQKKDGEGYTYIARDIIEDRRVWVREYLPDALSGRNKKTLEAVARPGSETQFKALRGDFIELAQVLKDTDAKEGILPVIDNFEENNTAYAVYEYRDSVKLSEYIKNVSGAFSWDQTWMLFAPVLNSISILHDKGIIHRGISPDTLFLDSEGNLIITDFLIAPARIQKSELNAVLSHGFAAPEQYNLSSWQGTWTDVYAIAASIYFALSGKTPQSSTSRAKQDNLVSLKNVAPNTPKNVITAINDAMVLTPDKRIETVGELCQRLLSSKVETKKQITEPSRTVVTKTTYKKRRRRYTNFPFFIASLIITVVILVPLVNKGFKKFAGVDIFDKDYTISYNHNGESSDAVADDTETTVTSKYTVPNFVGEYLDTIKSDKNYIIKYDVVEVHEYSEEYPSGMVFEQDIEAGTEVDGTFTVTLTISKGKRTIPELKNMEISQAEAILLEYGIEYEIILMNDDTIKEGRVVRYYRTPDQVTIYVSEGPEEPEESETEEGTIWDRSPDSPADSSSSTPTIWETFGL